jgi:hypothetical protein
MANQYRKVLSITLYANSEGKATHGNSNWKPYKDGSPADVHLRKDAKYSVKLFHNDDGSLGVSLSEVIIGNYTDSISDGVSQPGMRSLAESIDPPKSPIASIKDELDDADEIPF